MKKKTNFNAIEFLVTLVIIAVIIHTFLEDFALLNNWSSESRDFLMILGFAFDLFFTLEFLTRLYLAQIGKGMGHYFLHQYGWVDFLASVPLLMFSSGPSFLTYIIPDLGAIGLGSLVGFISLLKLIKTIRIARILRLLRIIKVFRGIKYADSPMAQRHVAKIITIAVSVIVAGVFGASIVSSALNISTTKEVYQKNRDNYLSMIRESADNAGAFKLTMDTILLTEKVHDLISVSRDNKSYYSRFDSKTLANLPKEAKITYLLNSSGITVSFDMRNENIGLERIQAQDSITFFCIVLLVVIAYLIFYSPHFAMTVSDPVNVMKQGMDQKEYNLEVKVPELFEDDDIFQLARLFNEKFLPLKDREGNKSEEKASVLNLGLADIQDFMDNEI